MTPHQENWRKFVLPHLPDTKRRWLELGSFEGRSAGWVLANALRPGDELVCVDTWRNPEIEDRFDANIGSRATKFVGKSTTYMAKAIANGEKFHVVYVDADHRPQAVLHDGVMAYLVLHPGGVIVFDDYPWTHPNGEPGPAAGIDAFLELHSHTVNVLHRGWQVIVRRTGLF